MEPCTKEGEIASLKSDIRTIFKRIDEQIELSKSVHELAASVKVMSSTLANVEKSVQKMESEIDEVKARPAKRWDGMVDTVFKVAVTAIIVAVLAKFGL